MIDPYLHSNNNSMHTSAFQNFMIAPGSMMGGPQGFMNPKDYGMMQSQYGGTSMGLGSSPYGYMYDNPMVSKLGMETGIISRPMGTNYAVTAMHQSNVGAMISGTLASGAIEAGGMMGGAAIGASLGGLPGMLIGGFLGEGAVSPVTDVLNKRTMEKMAVHQSLGGLANNDSPYGGGFGFSRKTSQSLYRNMEKMSTEDVSFTTGEMTMMLSEGINSGDITGNTVQELNKKLEKTKETIKILSQITGNNKIGELSDMIRQMTTVGFDSSAVAEVTHGMTFAARRLGQNPDDYRNKIVQGAINAEAYGGASAANTILAEPLVDSVLANSSIFKTLGNKDSVKKSANDLFAWSERNINNSNIHGMNAANITSEVQRGFMADFYAREKFAIDNEDSIQESMKTGITRGQAVETAWAMSSKEKKKEYAGTGVEGAKESIIRNGGVTGAMSEIISKSPELYSSYTAQRIGNMDKETMRKSSSLFVPILAEFLGSDKIVKDRVDQAAAVSVLGAQYGLREPLDQGGQAVLGLLQNAYANGDIEKQKKMRESDLLSSRVAEKKRNNTFLAEVKKSINKLGVMFGAAGDLITMEESREEDGTGQYFISKMIYGKDRKMFADKVNTNQEIMEKLGDLREGTKDGSIWLSRISDTDIRQMGYRGNHAPVPINDKNRDRPIIEGRVENTLDELTNDYSTFGHRLAAPQGLAMLSSGSQMQTYTNKKLMGVMSDMDAYQAGKMSADEFIEKGKKRDDDTVAELYDMASKARGGATYKELEGGMSENVKGLVNPYLLDKMTVEIEDENNSLSSWARSFTNQQPLNKGDNYLDTLAKAYKNTKKAVDGYRKEYTEEAKVVFDSKSKIQPGFKMEVADINGAPQISANAISEVGVEVGPTGFTMRDIAGGPITVPNSDKAEYSFSMIDMAKGVGKQKTPTDEATKRTYSAKEIREIENDEKIADYVEHYKIDGVPPEYSIKQQRAAQQRLADRGVGSGPPPPEHIERLGELEEIIYYVEHYKIDGVPPRYSLEQQRAAEKERFKLLGGTHPVNDKEYKKMLRVDVLDEIIDYVEHYKIDGVPPRYSLEQQRAAEKERSELLGGTPALSDKEHRKMLKREELERRLYSEDSSDEESILAGEELRKMDGESGPSFDEEGINKLNSEMTTESTSISAASFQTKLDSFKMDKSGKKDPIKKQNDAARSKLIKREIASNSITNINTFGVAIGISEGDMDVPRQKELRTLMGKQDPYLVDLVVNKIIPDVGTLEEKEDAARSVLKTIYDATEDNQLASMIADSDKVHEFKNVSVFADESKLAFQTSKSKDMRRGVAKYDRLSAEDKKLTFSMAKDIRETMDNTTGSPLRKRLAAESLAAKYKDSPELFGIATSVSPLDSLKNNDKEEGFTSDVAKFEGIGDATKVLEKVWNVNLDTKKKKGVAQALHQMLTQRNEGTTKRGMSNEQVRGILFNDDGTKKSDEELNSNPLSESVNQVYKDSEAASNLSPSEFAKTWKPGGMANRMIDTMMDGAHTRTVDGMSAAVNGGAASQDSLTGLVSRIVTIMESYKQEDNGKDKNIIATVH